MRIAVMHPGAMGVTLAQGLIESGHETFWVSAGRSAATTARAAPLNELRDLEELSAMDAVISVCPPDAAVNLAESIVAAGFAGVYVDANAVAPQSAAQIATLVGEHYVDGGIIGPPAVVAGTTRLYLSGDSAEQVADWFSAGALQAISLGAGSTRASMLKMAYAAYTKGSSALLLAVNALASAGDVSDALYREWEISQPGLLQRSGQTARGTSGKAWRFAGEMREIAATFADADLPNGFHLAAADLYAAMAALKTQSPASLETVIAEILKDSR